MLAGNWKMNPARASEAAELARGDNAVVKGGPAIDGNLVAQSVDVYRLPRPFPEQVTVKGPIAVGLDARALRRIPDDASARLGVRDRARRGVELGGALPTVRQAALCHARGTRHLLCARGLPGLSRRRRAVAPRHAAPR